MRSFMTKVYYWCLTKDISNYIALWGVPFLPAQEVFIKKRLRRKSRKALVNNELDVNQYCWKFM